ncbi:MAG: hypothetical protein ACRD8W_10905 [Nitrososphaeraceae archaeon]
MVQSSSKLVTAENNTGNIKHLVKLSVVGADAEPAIIIREEGIHGLRFKSKRPYCFVA